MIHYTLFSIPPLVTAVLMVIFGIFIYSRNRAAEQNKAFSLECACVALWFFGYSAMFSIREPAASAVFGKIGYIGVTFIPITFYHFTVAFLGIKARQSVRVAYLIGAAFLSLLLFTPLYISGVNDRFWGHYTSAGLLHPLYVLFFLVLYNWSLWLLFVHMRKPGLDAQHRNRIKYVFWAFFIPSMASVDFAPSYGVDVYPLGYLFIVAWLLVTGLAIVKHQLMEIEVVIKKTLVFAGLFVATYAVFSLFALLGQIVLERWTSAARWVTLLPSVVAVTFMFRPLEKVLINLTDRYLFQKKYDYKQLLKTFTSEVLSVIDLAKLGEVTVDRLVSVVKLDACALLCHDEASGDMKLVSAAGLDRGFENLSHSSELVRFLEETGSYILRSEEGPSSRFPDAIRRDMLMLRAELVIPLVLHEKLTGILALGKKKSDDDFGQDDMDILLPLARTLAIAISNAELFAQLSKTQAEAAQNEKMAVIGTLSAGINHEICNPLGIARGQCEAFLLNMRDGLYANKQPEELLKKAREIMQKVIHETDRATAITKRLSSFAKPSRGDVEEIDLKREVEEVIALVGYELKLDKIEIALTVEPDLPRVLADRKQIQEIFFNLIRNAAQAIGEKGSITVSAHRINGAVRIEIRDTGHGIPPNKIRELFNPFFTTKEPGKGTGLGLFIVRQVVQRNGGKIYLKETAVGGGTTFALEFPVTQPSEAHV